MRIGWTTSHSPTGLAFDAQRQSVLRIVRVEVELEGLLSLCTPRDSLCHLSTSSSAAQHLENAGVPSSVMHLEMWKPLFNQSLQHSLQSPALVFMVML